MHYDKKISLALGILLVGVVAALFFRHESTGAGEDAPQLKNEKAIDARIADKPNRPYGTPAKPAARSADKHATTDFSYDGFSDEGLPEGSPRAITQLGPPEPIKPRQTGTHAVAIMPLPDHNAAWSAGPATGAKTVVQARQQTTVEDDDDRVDYIQYRVKTGDTLSGIASKYLGSSHRYHEIYNLNRKVMRSPNDLRPGMILRVPSRKKRGSDTEALIVKSAPPPPSKSAGSSTLRDEDSTQRTTRNNSPNTKPGPLKNDRRFSPVRKSPFILWQRVGTEKLNTEPGKDNKKENKSNTTTPAPNRRLKVAPPPPTESEPKLVPDEPIAKSPPMRKETIPPTTPAGNRLYVIRRGDTLEEIAVRYYGTRRAVSRILDANRDRLRDPRRMRPGQTIILP